MGQIVLRTWRFQLSRARAVKEKSFHSGNFINHSMIQEAHLGEALSREIAFVMWLPEKIQRRMDSGHEKRAGITVDRASGWRLGIFASIAGSRAGVTAQLSHSIFELPLDARGIGYRHHLLRSTQSRLFLLTLFIRTPINSGH
jgi:hypothetical protein